MNRFITAIFALAALVATPGQVAAQTVELPSKPGKAGPSKPIEVDPQIEPQFEPQYQPGQFVPADGSCPGVTGWPGHFCQGMSYTGLLNWRVACDALCTWDAGEVIDGELSGHNAVPAGRTDVFAVDLEADGRLRIETRDEQGGCSAAADTTVQLHRLEPHGWAKFGPLYDDVAHLPGSPSGRCESVDVRVTAGRYAIEIAGFGGAEVRRYSYSIRAEAVVGGPGDYDGAFPVFGADLFAVELAAPARLCTDGTQQRCPGDTVMHATDLATGVVRFDDDGGADRCSCLDLPAGDHEVRISGYDDGAMPPYVLTVP